jgi:hypothetical protein
MTVARDEGDKNEVAIGHSKGSLHFSQLGSLSLSSVSLRSETRRSHGLKMLAATFVASLAAVASLSTAASAQSLSDIPTCAVTCLTQVLPSSP